MNEMNTGVQNCGWYCYESSSGSGDFKIAKFQQ